MANKSRMQELADRLRIQKDLAESLDAKVKEATEIAVQAQIAASEAQRNLQALRQARMDNAALMDTDKQEMLDILDVVDFPRPADGGPF